MIVTGVVEEVVVRNPKPGLTAYDVIVNGIKYGHGFIKPKVAKGDRVQFEALQHGQFANIKGGSLALYEGKDEPQDPPSNALERGTSNQKGGTATPLPTHSRTYAQNDDERQNRITFEATRKQAMDFVALLQQCDALWMKKVDKPADRFDYVRKLVEDTHRRFYNEATHRAEYLGNKPLTDEDLSISNTLAGNPLGVEPADGEWK